MNNKYSRKQIEESIEYWKKRLNEDIDIDNSQKDSLINIVYQLEDIVAWMSNQNENCTDNDRRAIENVFDWSETSKEFISLVAALAKSIGIKLKHFNY